MALGLFWGTNCRLPLSETKMHPMNTHARISRNNFNFNFLCSCLMSKQQLSPNLDGSMSNFKANIQTLFIPNIRYQISDVLFVCEVPTSWSYVSQ